MFGAAAQPLADFGDRVAQSVRVVSGASADGIQDVVLGREEMVGLPPAGQRYVAGLFGECGGAVDQRGVECGALGFVNRERVTMGELAGRDPLLVDGDVTSVRRGKTQ